MCVRFLGFVLLICLAGVLRAQGPEPPCESPQLQGGFSVIEEDTDSHERKLFYACDDGLKPAVEGWWGTATCQNRTWIPTPQCIDANACIAPEIPNAKYTKSPNGWHEEGHKIRVTCIDGYEDRNHLAIAQCVNGNWTSMPVCERDVHACGPPPKILNAVIIKQVFQKVFLDNSEVEYACEDGYTSNTGAIQKSYCVFGNWTAVSECIRETQPDTGRGGSAAGGTGATSGHTTSTDRGTTSGTDRDTDDRRVTGSSTRGVGGDTGPFISIDKCGTPPRIDNGDFVEKTLKYLKYQCSAFYTLEGSDTVVCNSDGSW
ncbi:complement factor H-related protein 2-like [Sphaeramia orbicularis]|uniref:complement factor H-related protein 2-like n=1 Tax=Sphaeramia orbicularis TaxID=375764 RepID=UPI00117C3D72|nr:complement factor H-related protein 2-like [Sphaeramia orbicularis]